MTYRLYEVEQFVKNKKYKELELYLKEYKTYSYSFLEFLQFIKHQNNISNELDIVINNFLDYDNLNKKDTVIRADSKYKEDVKALFNYKCGVTNTLLCNEVAHIQEFKDCKYDNDRYCKFNGIYLQDNIHKLWDKYELIVIDYNNNDKEIFFKINVNKLNKETNNIEILKEILNKCSIQEIENKYKYLEDIKIPININKEYFNEYKYYINKRNNN